MNLFSDQPALQELITKNKITLKNGEVFIAENVNSFVAAVNKVLANEKRYKKVYTKTVLKQRSWELQAKVLVDLYNKLVGVKPKIRKGKPFTIKC